MTWSASYVVSLACTLTQFADWSIAPTGELTTTRSPRAAASARGSACAPSVNRRTPPWLASSAPIPPQVLKTCRPNSNEVVGGKYPKSDARKCRAGPDRTAPSTHDRTVRWSRVCAWGADHGRSAGTDAASWSSSWTAPSSCTTSSADIGNHRSINLSTPRTTGRSSGAVSSRVFGIRPAVSDRAVPSNKYWKRPCVPLSNMSTPKRSASPSTCRCCG